MVDVAEKALDVSTATVAGVLTALTQAPLGVAIFDREMRYLAASSQFLTDQGLPGDTPLLGRLHYEVFPEVPQAWREVHAQALRTGEAVGREADVYQRRDGSSEWLRWLVKPWRTADGEIGGLVLYTEIVTASVEAKNQLRLMIDELNHRVKNTLAMVQSMAAQTLRGETDPKVAFDKFEGRLMGLSHVHDLLTREHWDGAPLRDVAERALHPFVSDRPGKVRLDGANVWLPPAAALPMALVFHELATNAVKHGALSEPAGAIELSWVLRAGDRRLSLEWRESGGPAVSPPSRRGFGSRLIDRAFRGELAGSSQMIFRPEGMVCTIEAVLPA